MANSTNNPISVKLQFPLGLILGLLVSILVDAWWSGGTTSTVPDNDNGSQAPTITKAQYSKAGPIGIVESLSTMRDSELRNLRWIQHVRKLLSHDWRGAAELLLLYPGDRLHPNFTDALAEILAKGEMEAFVMLARPEVGYYALLAAMYKYNPKQLGPYINKLADTASLYDPVGMLNIGPPKPADWDVVVRKLVADAKIDQMPGPQLTSAARFLSAQDATLVWSGANSNTISANLALAVIARTIEPAANQIVEMIDAAKALPGKHQSLEQLEAIGAFYTRANGSEQVLELALQQESVETQARLLKGMINYMNSKDFTAGLRLVLDDARIRENPTLVKAVIPHAISGTPTPDQWIQLQKLANSNENVAAAILQVQSDQNKVQ